MPLARRVEPVLVAPRVSGQALLRVTALSGLVALAAALLAMSGASPVAASRALSLTGTDPTAPLVAVATLLAWACIAWLALVCVLATVAAVPGAVGRAAARLARVCTPWAVRRLLAGTLGISTLLAAPTAALADSTPGPIRPASATTLDLGMDWPGLDQQAGPPAPAASTARPPAPAPAVPSPAASTPGAQTVGPTAGPAAGPAAGPTAPARPGPVVPVDATDVTGTATDTTVVVRPGDSLWTVVARSLGPSATPKAVATAWPAWWAANREALGADPGLIHPGDRLLPPAPAQDGAGNHNADR